MNDKTLQEFLNDLKNTDPAVRETATQALWTTWHREAGELAEFQLNRGVALMAERQLDQARENFADLCEKFPDFPEGHNKLATVLYLMGRYLESVIECDITLEKNPHHFGAWNGKGLCLYNLGKFEEAILCFQRALEIQPYADVNLHYIGRCRRKLN
ncbi:MAG: hypothetical protein COV67_04740 [Nitrospinae bacterium CG11_big_fil_rev_8_21_14_0_20_56_8]|nr:MAG: hypothetical protein COV67_04740 [Nitrospinae bacterium CG11_big_fil_rev_8_21_14_0_20_56_8]